MGRCGNATFVGSVMPGIMETGMVGHREVKRESKATEGRAEYVAES